MHLTREDYWGSKNATNGNSAIDTAAVKGQTAAATTSTAESVLMDDGDIDMIE